MAKTFRRISTLGIIVAAIAIISIGVSGCGQNSPNKKDEADRVGLTKTLRSYFDKAQGDYSKLSEADKAEFVKLSGSEEKAAQNWELMKNGPSRSPAGGQ